MSGSWLAVGAPFEDTAFPQPIGTDVGAVYLYKTNGFGFYQHHASIFGTQDGQNFGMDVELDEGNVGGRSTRRRCQSTIHPSV